MVNKTNSFKKKGKGKKGNFKKNGKQVATPVKKPKARPKPASTAKGMVTRSGTTPNTWRIRRMARSTEVFWIYVILMCTLLVLLVAPGY